MSCGLTQYWYNKFKSDDVCDDVTRTLPSGTQIRLEDSIWVFAVLGCGMVLAVLFLCIEIIIHMQKTVHHDSVMTYEVGITESVSLFYADVRNAIYEAWPSR